MTSKILLQRPRESLSQLIICLFVIHRKAMNCENNVQDILGEFHVSFI